MSKQFEVFLAIVIIIFGVGIIGTIIGLEIHDSCIDYSQAKFEPGDMIMPKVGGIGQVLKCTGTNKGPIWNMTPFFEYEIRISGSDKQTFQEWELEDEPC